MFYKTTKELNVLLLSSTFPKPAVARYKKTVLHFTRKHKNTKLHKLQDNTKTTFEKRPIEVEQDGTIGKNATKPTVGHAAFR